MTDAEKIARQLGQAQHSSSGWLRCRCPAHNSSGATLALRDTSSGIVFYCHAGCTRDAIRDELGRLGLLNGASNECSHSADPERIRQQREAEARDRQRRIRAALHLWHNETVPAEGTIIEAYWRSRGLGDLPIPPTIRASRSWIRHSEGGSRPALIALVEHVDHGLVAIHRTYLTIDGSGKAAFRQPRLSLGPVGGAAVRLADTNETLVVAEGIETAASVMVATGLPAWSGLSAAAATRCDRHHRRGSRR
jgi:putative DNA primase/helicase